jgi:hypothetical protein
VTVRVSDGFAGSLRVLLDFVGGLSKRLGKKETQHWSVKTEVGSEFQEREQICDLLRSAT